MDWDGRGMIGKEENGLECETINWDGRERRGSIVKEEDGLGWERMV